MSKIIRIIASTSKNSINKKLSDYAIDKMKINDEIHTIWLKDINLPLFSVDIENEGFPKELIEIYETINQSQKIIFANPENNGYLTAALKNLLDWLSRINTKYLQDKKVMILSTSTGKGGAKKSLEELCIIMGHVNAELVSTYSLSKFNDNFDIVSNKIINEEENSNLKFALDLFINS